MTSKKPAAFLSYVREVDVQGDVTRLRVALEQAVREHGWDEFTIFHDRVDIQLGDDWRERVLRSLAEVQILIPIISPGLLKSEACRFEIKTLLERENAAEGQSPMILPIYFVTTPAFEHDPRTVDDRVDDELVEVLSERTYLDYRKLRIKPSSDEAYRAAIIGVAGRIAKLLEQLTKAQDQQVAPVKRDPEQKADVPSGHKKLKGGRKRRSMLATSVVIFCALGASALWWFMGDTLVEPRLLQHKVEVYPLSDSCVVQRSTQAYRAPDPSAMLGPFLSPGERIDLVGRVADPPWLVSSEADGRQFYFPEHACAR